MRKKNIGVRSPRTRLPIASRHGRSAGWVSRRPTTAERMCRLLVHGYLLASSLLECIVLFEYAAWRYAQATGIAPGQKSRKRCPKSTRETRKNDIHGFSGRLRK